MAKRVATAVSGVIDRVSPTFLKRAVTCPCYDPRQATRDKRFVDVIIAGARAGAGVKRGDR